MPNNNAAQDAPLNAAVGSPSLLSYLWLGFFLSPSYFLDFQTFHLLPLSQNICINHEKRALIIPKNTLSVLNKNN